MFILEFRFRFWLILGCQRGIRTRRPECGVLGAMALYFFSAQRALTRTPRTLTEQDVLGRWGQVTFRCLLREWWLCCFFIALQYVDLWGCPRSCLLGWTLAAEPLLLIDKATLGDCVRCPLLYLSNVPTQPLNLLRKPFGSPKALGQKC